MVGGPQTPLHTLQVGQRPCIGIPHNKQTATLRFLLRSEFSKGVGNVPGTLQTFCQPYWNITGTFPASIVVILHSHWFVHHYTNLTNILFMAKRLTAQPYDPNIPGGCFFWPNFQPLENVFFRYLTSSQMLKQPKKSLKSNFLGLATFLKIWSRNTV